MGKRKKFEKKDLEKYWNVWLKEHGIQPSFDEWKGNKDFPSIWIVRGIFGSWKKFVKKMDGEICGLKTRKMLEAELKIGMPMKNFLQEKYQREKKGVPEIAEIIGVGETTIFYWMSKLRIKRRNIREALYARLGKMIEMPSKKQLKKWYEKERKSLKWIGDKVDVKYTTVRGWLKDDGIRLRDQHEANFLKLGKNPVEKPPYKVLYRLYIEDDLTREAVAKKFNVHVGTAQRWLNMDGIKKGYKSQYAEKSITKEICNKLLLSLNKKPEELVVTDFTKKAKEKLGKDYAGILLFYQKKFKLKSYTEALEKLLDDSYNIKIKIEYPPREDYSQWENRKSIADMLLKISNKNPEQLKFYDFTNKKKLSKNYSGLVNYYREKFKLKSNYGALGMLVQDLYRSRLKIEEKKQDSVILKEGFNDYIIYINKCKKEGKELLTFKSFCRKYDPKTLNITKSSPPLGRYIARYQAQMRKVSQATKISFGEWVLNQLDPKDRTKYESLLRETKNLELEEKKPHECWKDLSSVKKELDSVIEKLGYFPTAKELRKQGLGGLVYYIYKYHDGFKNVRLLLGYSQNSKIKTEKSLVELIDSDEKARKVVKRFGGDEGDVADIFAVVYEGRLSRKDAAQLITRPSVREYLGRFKRPLGGIGELVDAGYELLPYDKNQVIKEILYRKVKEYIHERLGPYPSKQEKKALLDEFEGELGNVCSKSIKNN